MVITRNGATNDQTEDVSNTAMSEITLGSLLTLVTNLQIEMADMRRSNRQGDSDEDRSDVLDRAEDGTIEVVPYRTRVMHPSELLRLGHGNLVPAVCHDPRFPPSLDYRYYRLIKRSEHYTAQTAAKVARWTRQIEASFRLRFSGADPLAILQYLGAFVDATNANGIREGAALFILPSFLNSPAREEFNACRLRAFSVAVDWLLATFAPVELLAGEYKRISNFLQGLNETPPEFSLRIRTAASRLGSLMDTASVSILLEGLHPSISRFVRSALRDQRPTFANVIQEAELIHRSITATTPVQNPRTSPGSYSRTRPEILRPYQGARPTPVLALETGPYFGDSVNEEVPGQFFQHQVEPLCHSARVDPGSFDSVETAFDKILLSTLALPQQVRYCYKCWRPGHFSAECSLIPKGEREAIAKLRAEIMRSRPSRFPSKYGPRSQTPADTAATNLVASTVDSIEPLASPEKYQLPDEPVRLRKNL
jgi:hypothetical protein